MNSSVFLLRNGGILVPLKKPRKRAEQFHLPLEDFAFVHDNNSRGMNICDTDIGEKLSIIRLTIDRPGMLSYRDVIENATEVYCIDGSCYHLVESLEPKGKRFLHRYARWFKPVRWRWSWSTEQRSFCFWQKG
jgi:hypothetical protein